MITTFDPGAIMKNGEHGEKGIFAVPAVPKKTIVLPRRPSFAPPSSDSLPAVVKIKKPISEDIIHDPLQRLPIENGLGSEESKTVEEVNQKPTTDQPSSTDPPTSTTGPGSEEAVSNMLVSIAGILRKRSSERIKNVAGRFGRLNSFYITRAVANTLKGGKINQQSISYFHPDRLAREFSMFDQVVQFCSEHVNYPTVA